MENLLEFNDPDLLKMLMAYTIKYTHLITTHKMNTPEFTKCKAMLKNIQVEIESRQDVNQEVKQD